MEHSSRAPDWGFWTHVPTLTLHEAVALSLNICPKRLRGASGRAMIAGKRYDEGPEFERRLELVRRCLGHTLPGPENTVSVSYGDAEATIRLLGFLSWARSIGWSMPPPLVRLEANQEHRTPTSTAPQNPPTSVIAQAESPAGPPLEERFGDLPNRPAEASVPANPGLAAVSAVQIISRKEATVKQRAQYEPDLESFMTYPNRKARLKEMTARGVAERYLKSHKARREKGEDVPALPGTNILSRVENIVLKIRHRQNREARKEAANKADANNG